MTYDEQYKAMSTFIEQLIDDISDKESDAFTMDKIRQMLSDNGIIGTIAEPEVTISGVEYVIYI